MEALFRAHGRYKNIIYKYSPLLKNRRHQVPNQSDYKSKVDKWQEHVENQIELEEQRLISIKRLHTVRYSTRDETAVYKTKYERGAYRPPEFPDIVRAPERTPRQHHNQFCCNKFGCDNEVQVVNDESEDEEEIETEISKLTEDLEKAIQDDSKTHDERRKYLKKVKFLLNNIAI